MILNLDIHLINGYVHLHLKDIDYLFDHEYQFHILKRLLIKTVIQFGDQFWQHFLKK